MPSQPPSNSYIVDLVQASEWLLTNFVQGDAGGVAAVYATNGQLLPAYSTAISGRTAIQAFWQGCIDMGIRAFQNSPTEVELLGATANEVGCYTLVGPKGSVLDVGNYVVIWKQQAGQWKIYRHIWTSSLPSA